MNNSERYSHYEWVSVYWSISSWVCKLGISVFIWVFCDNKLVIFHGCRNIKDSEQDPYHSENEQGVTIERGGAKYGYKNKRKNTSKKNKKINKQKKHSTREYKK